MLIVFCLSRHCGFTEKGAEGDSALTYEVGCKFVFVRGAFELFFFFHLSTFDFFLVRSDRG